MHEKQTAVPHNAESGFQSFVGMLNFHQLVSKFIKKIQQTIIRSFWFKVMNSPVYSIQREVIKEFEVLKSQI